MANTTGECISDKDCILGLHCFFDEDENKDICGCSGYYGWKGENCTDIGPITVAYVFFSSTELVLVAIGLAFCVKDLLYIKRKRIPVALNSNTLCWAYALVGLLLFFIWQMNEIVSALTPEKNTFFPPDSGHFEKAHEYVLVSRFLSALVFVCSMNGMLLVGFVWLKVVYKSERMIVEDSLALLRFRRFIYANQVGTSLMFLYCVLQARYSLVSYFMIPYTILIWICYSIGSFKFRRLFKSLLEASYSKNGNADTYKQVLGNVNRASILVICFIGLTLLSSIVYAIQDVNRPNYLIGNFPIGMLSGEGVIFFILLILLTLSWYTRQTLYIGSTNPNSAKFSKSSALGGKSLPHQNSISMSDI